MGARVCQPSVPPAAELLDGPHWHRVGVLESRNDGRWDLITGTERLDSKKFLNCKKEKKLCVIKSLCLFLQPARRLCLCRLGIGEAVWPCSGRGLRWAAMARSWGLSRGLSQGEHRGRDERNQVHEPSTVPGGAGSQLSGRRAPAGHRVLMTHDLSVVGSRSEGRSSQGKPWRQAHALRHGKGAFRRS